MKTKRLTALALVLVLLFSFSANAAALSAEGACSMDFETGEIFFEKNADTPMVPASLTKMMTLFIIYEKMAAGELSGDTLIPVSYAAAHPKDPAAVNVPLTVGEKLPLSQIVDAAAIVSACGCCTAAAEYICGSEDAFAALMNETAAKYGIDAYFTDASGLSDENRITPRGAASLVRLFLQKYPQITEVTKKQEVYIKGKKYLSTNKLLKSGTFFFDGADGFKTGTTTLAGKCIAATAVRGGARMISVSMKSKTDSDRYTDATFLLNGAFDRARYLNENLFETDIKTFVNGNEIPCCYALGKNKALCIIAENLNYYGFDTYYDGAANTLFIYQNTAKAISPLKSTKGTAGDALFKIYTPSTPRVVLVKDGVQNPLDTVFSLNGQCCISIDELGAHFAFSWDGASRTANLLLP